MTNVEKIYTGEIRNITTLDPFGEEFTVRAILHGDVWIVEIWEDVWEMCPDMNDPFDMSEPVAVAAYSLDSNGDAHVVIQE